MIPVTRYLFTNEDGNEVPVASERDIDLKEQEASTLLTRYEAIRGATEAIEEDIKQLRSVTATVRPLCRAEHYALELPTPGELNTLLKRSAVTREGIRYVDMKLINERLFCQSVFVADTTISGGYRRLAKAEVDDLPAHIGVYLFRRFYRELGIIDDDIQPYGEVVGSLRLGIAA